MSEILYMALNILWWIIIIHFIMSWLIQFDVLNIRQPIVGQLWYTLSQITNPIYDPIRRFIPTIGGLDLSPIVMIFIIRSLQILLQKYPF